MNTHCTVAARAIAAGVLGISLMSCARSGPPIPEDEYSAELVGHWQGTAGSENEFMSIDSNGRFVCQLHPRGFLANTLSQGVAGTVSGTWHVSGKTLTLVVDDTKHENLQNLTTSSEIVSFSNRILVLKPDRGSVSTFYRNR